MYFTEIKLDAKSYRRQHDLTDPRRYHGYIERSFPTEIKNRVRKRHLWRLEYDNKLILISADKPDTKRLMKYATKVGTIDYDLFLSELKSDKIYHFKLIANPTKRNIRTRRRVPLLTMDEQGNWLQNKSDQHGFHLINYSIHPTAARTIHSKQYNINSICYIGRLRIIDLPEFKSALCNGIGQERAYGRGLLTIEPEQE